MFKFLILSVALVLTSGFTAEVKPLPIEFTTQRSAVRLEDQRRILYFTASWCRPCREVQEPLLASMKKSGWLITEPGQTAHIWVHDIDRLYNWQAKMKYEVTQVPTFICVDGTGRLLSRAEGPQTADQLNAMLRK